MGSSFKNLETKNLEKFLRTLDHFYLSNFNFWRRKLKFCIFELKTDILLIKFNDKKSSDKK